MANPNCWSRSWGPRRGERVRVYERNPGGTLYVSVWLPGEGERRTSLQHGFCSGWTLDCDDGFWPG